MLKIICNIKVIYGIFTLKAFFKKKYLNIFIKNVGKFKIKKLIYKVFNSRGEATVLCFKPRPQTSFTQNKK